MIEQTLNNLYEIVECPVACVALLYQFSSDYVTPVILRSMDWPDVLRLKQRRTLWLNKIYPLYIRRVFADWNAVELYDWTWPLLNGLSQALRSMGDECEQFNDRDWFIKLTGFIDTLYTIRAPRQFPKIITRVLLIKTQEELEQWKRNPNPHADQKRRRKNDNRRAKNRALIVGETRASVGNKQKQMRIKDDSGTDPDDDEET